MLFAVCLSRQESSDPQILFNLRQSQTPDIAVKLSEQIPIILEVPSIDPRIRRELKL